MIILQEEENNYSLLHRFFDNTYYLYGNILDKGTEKFLSRPINQKHYFKNTETTLGQYKSMFDFHKNGAFTNLCAMIARMRDLFRGALMTMLLRRKIYRNP